MDLVDLWGWHTGWNGTRGWHTGLFFLFFIFFVYTIFYFLYFFILTARRGDLAATSQKVYHDSRGAVGYAVLEEGYTYVETLPIERLPERRSSLYSGALLVGTTFDGF